MERDYLSAQERLEIINMLRMMKGFEAKLKEILKRDKPVYTISSLSHDPNMKET